VVALEGGVVTHIILHSLSMPQCLPPLYGEAMKQERFIRKRFGKNVSWLFLSINFVDGEGFVRIIFTSIHKGAEEVIAIVDMFGPGTIFGNRGNFNGTRVVLKNLAVYVS
jgi:hypothetical protein